MLNALSLLAASPFYSVILGLSGTTDSPHLPVLGTKTNVVSATLVASPFLIFHNFLLLVFLPQKPPVDFPFWGVLKELTFGPSSFKAFTLFRLRFWLPFLLSFFPSELIPSY